MDGHAERILAPRNFFSTLPSSPTSERTGSSSITISVSPDRLVFPTHGRIGGRALMGFMAMAYARVLPILKSSVPTRHSMNLSRRIQITEKTALKIRFDVVNLFDKVYELRSGSGIGVFAPQFGQRRGFYGTVAYEF